MENFKNAQKKRQIEFANKNCYQLGGLYRGKENDSILTNTGENLFHSIRKEANDYFKDNKISWWGGKKVTGHLLSSQVACLNHLFLLREDKEAVLQLVNNVRDEFIDVLPIYCDKKPAYISFEVTSNKDHLNELEDTSKTITRGSNYTSIDALILAKHQSGKIYLIPIEWKYTESYGNLDKSTDSNRGDERLKRYSDLINCSKSLTCLPEYRSSVYFFEPFYQLMRQTLWAEQMIKNSTDELIKADDYLHVHIVPNGNRQLLEKKYPVSGKNMKTTWIDTLKCNSKYILIDPACFMRDIDKKYPELVEYLSGRYWQK